MTWSPTRNRTGVALAARCLLVLGLSGVFFGHTASYVHADNSNGTDDSGPGNGDIGNDNGNDNGSGNGGDTTGGGTKHANCGHTAKFVVKKGKKELVTIYLRPHCDKDEESDDKSSFGKNEDEDRGNGFDFTSQKPSSRAPKGTIFQFTVGYFNASGNDICAINPNATLPFKVDVRANRTGYQLDRLPTTGAPKVVGTISKKYNISFQKCGTYDVVPQKTVVKKK